MHVIFLEKSKWYEPEIFLEHIGIDCLNLKIDLGALGLIFWSLEFLSRPKKPLNSVLESSF
jgi:hypothetical protein